jgi:hypothetical protein
LHIPGASSAAERDRLAAFAVMSRIASLLPVELRGQFSNIP